MNAGLHARAFRGLAWSTLHQVSVQGVQLVVGIVLARLLLPAEFGLVAMLTIFTSLAQSFIDSGFGAALIQKPKLDQTDTSTVFYFSIVVAVALAGLLAVAAPAIAAFYHQPMLTPLTRVLALNLVVNSFGVVQTNLLTKHLEFRGQTLAAMAAAGVSGSVGVAMALYGFGVWSLVGQSLLSTAVRTILLWFVSDWRPARSFSFRALKGMFSFGSRLAAAGLIFTVIDNLHLLIIGKLFSATQLGLYTRARRLQETPTVGFTAIISRITFPAFSEIQDDDALLRLAVHKAVTTSVFINFPLMIGIAACAKPLVLLLLTEKWLPCVPYLQLLCLVGLSYPLHVINLNLVIAKGRSDLVLRLEVLKDALVLTGIAAGWPFGVTGLICAQIVVSLICFYLNSHYTGKLIGYAFLSQFRAIFPYLGVSVAMGFLVYASTLFPFEGPATLLIAQVVAGVAAYCAGCWLLKLSALTEVWVLLKKWVLALVPA